MKENVVSLLNDLEINYRCFDHPAVFTISDLKNLPEDMNPVKNLLVQESNSGRKFLIIMAGDARLDTNVVRRAFEARRLCFATDEILMDTFGVKSGAVSIFGLLNNPKSDVEVIIDQEIMKFNELGFHPNENTSTIFFEPKYIESILKRIGRKYTVMKLYD